MAMMAILMSAVPLVLMAQDLGIEYKRKPSDAVAGVPQDC